MSKNYMKEVVNLLGLELEEEFRIKGQDNYLYKFSNDRLLFKYLDRDWHNCFYIIFEKLWRGEYEIEKLILDQKEKSILDQKEKEYLSYVIKPFRDRVKYISKWGNYTKEFIVIRLNGEEILLPYFETNTMYKGMELDKEYTLEELGL